MKICEIEGCPSGVLAKSLCSKHYNRLRRKGATSDDRRNRRAVCVVDECTRGSAAYGYCHNHKHLSEQYAARREAKLISHRTGRLCLFCEGPIPLERPADAIYCSRRCKERQRAKDGRASAASLRWHFKVLYGLTVQQVEEMSAKGCAICGTTDWPGRHNRPQIDHDHKTGRVRGVLCSECNTGLGKFKDSAELLTRAIAYLS